jgi:hypothetical protein
VLAEATRLDQSLGATDRAMLDEYLGNVRQVEIQLKKMEARSSNITETPDAPIGIPDQFDTHLTLTYDLMRLAFQGDISRVFSFMLGHEGSSRSYAVIGIPEPHHPVTHHGDTPGGIEKYAKITTYQQAKFAEFVAKLKATPDGDATLLDNVVLYWGAGMSNGNAHDRRNAPALIVGHGGGRLAGNMSIHVENAEPTSNLLLTFAQMAGSDITSIGRSTGTLTLST